MSATRDFYLARAAECARDAATATLDNVRERLHRSEAAWLSMADRIARSEEMRDTAAAGKAATAAEPDA